ncbi:amino acid adenylation domain-containing protein [Actinoplanes sp. NPDC048791]|uniref:non-ribosomal peptide synthetase n=1 Tax=Actinoplanes sp. NPDC048791 TaxID=3154623 RepID=UPI0033CA9727
MSAPPHHPRPTPSEDAPLSVMQRRLWIFERLHPGTAVYNICVAIRLDGPIDPATLQRALDEVVARHDALRTRIDIRDGEPRLHVSAAARVLLRTPQLGTDPAATQVSAFIDAEAMKPFDLAAAPLLRAVLIRLGAAEHVLVLTAHHIVSDGWSFDVLLRDLGVAYQAAQTGAPGDLGEAAPRYIDFARRQGSERSGDDRSAQLSYWLDRLRAPRSVLELAADRPRPEVPAFHGRRATILVDRNSSDAVIALGRRHRASPFMTFLSVFAALLHRWTGQPDLIIGSPVSGRTEPSLQNVVGFFVNTLPLRIEVSGDPTFAELLARVRQTQLDAYTRQDVRLEELVEQLKPERRLNRNPLFDVMFNFINRPAAAPALGAASGTFLEVAACAPQCDLNVVMQQEAQGYALRIEYDQDLFDHVRIERFAAHFQQLLTDVVRDPELTVSRLPMIPAEEHARHQRWNATGHQFPQDATLDSLFHDQAVRTPDATAIIHGDAGLTYAEVDRLAGLAAAALRRRLPATGGLVGICLERSADLLVAVLAVSRAGAAYVPLDPNYPRERLAAMLQDSGAPVVLTSRAVGDRLPPSSAATVYIADITGAAPETPPGDDRPAHNAEATAYVIYTSGSTGRPKGVMVPHRGVVNLLFSVAELIRLRPDDRLLAVTSLSFDISVLELFCPMLTGACVVVADEEQVRSGELLDAAIRRHAITVMQATPSTWRLLLATDPEPARLRVLCGGEAFPPDLVPGLLRYAATVFNVYGPTETTIWSTAHQVTAADVSVPIGRPLWNTTTFILDAAMQAVPVGVTGELYLGGAGVTAGYLNRPELTRQRFVPDPFGAPGARLYRTGDLARYREDGTIDYHGRTDHQVKLRGHRIEPGEIEAALRADRSIAQAVVVVREDLPGLQQLVAYLVAGRGATVGSGAELRSRLSQSLPDYMVPSAYVTLNALPLTPNGKLDRAALPPVQPDGQPEGDSAAPATPTEKVIAGIWCAALGRTGLGAGENFFAIGGHSLLAIRLIQQVNDRLNVRLSSREAFRSPTVRELARVIDDVSASADRKGNPS